ncbi:uncharacterized protein G2W53_004300 [Senna tora]|uniref:Uncharacterized protein n=1 Tax=Senna tora TaxID=362788 RepID=A0A834XCS7_9FABA|nr:uncharacterized protein G2W53_004300 [Senna tora]
MVFDGDKPSKITMVFDGDKPSNI